MATNTYNPGPCGCFPPAKWILELAADDLLLQEVMRDLEFQRYCRLIIDKAHERSTSIDASMMLLKNVVQHRKELKVIIMYEMLAASTEGIAGYFGRVPVIRIQASMTHCTSSNLMAT
ncbi:hypothetical protein GGS26DRAFT_392822 [Hypomontagnella submonticulosa]|nr:hypothetical protein GGS26DRAFT_392822 [Hypomontagnella submonticulosa]